ncbi:MAG: hypothetical protein ACTSQF_05935 [Candidatus Heimdallarchaeaceae archaeon]
MTQSIGKSQTEESISSTLVPDRHLHNQLLNISSLAKIVFLGLLYAFFYFITYLLKVYFYYSIYFPIVSIFVIFTGFGVWTTSFFVMFSITGTKVEKSLLKKIFPLLIVLGVLTAYLAIVMENKFLSLVTVLVETPLFFGASVNLTFAQLINTIFYVYVVPVLEEIAKIFPVLILMGNFAKISVKDHKIITPLTPSHRTIVLFGAFFGAWFDLFGQLLSFSVTSDVVSLISTRTVYPIHSVTTMITAFGLGWIFVSRKSLNKILKILVFLVSLTFSSVFHSLWNYNYWTVEDPVVRLNNLTTLGYISYGLFAFFLLWILFKVPKLCSKCHSEHLKKDCGLPKSSVRKIGFKLNRSKTIKEIYDESIELMRCPECQVVLYNGESCMNCWSFPKLQCENCNQVIPAFSRNCWACGAEVPSLTDKMSSSSPPIFVNIAVGLTRILGLGLIVIFFFVFLEASNTLDFLGNTIFILGVLISFGIAIFWHKSSKNRVKSLIVSISITAILALIVIVMVIYLGIIASFFISSITQLVLSILALIILILLAVGCIIFLVRSIGGTNLIII